MPTLKNLTGGLEKKYIAYTCLSPFTMIGEVVMETMIPYIMSRIIDVGIAQGDIAYVVRTGGIMIGCAIVSLLCGTAGAFFAASASQGFSHNLRRKLFANVQDFSFADIDEFGTASLVTRLTVDVTNAQNVYQMLIRPSVRAPFMLISGTVMAYVINRRLASIFLVSIPILIIAIAIVSSKAYPRFGKMLAKYDALNTIIQENLIAIRVVKAFVRGKFECEKFAFSADAVRRAQVSAEKVVLWILPVMQMTVYSTIIASLWFGGNMIIAGDMKTGELVSFLSYITQILMSLLMLGMIFVSLVLSRASITRINEVLDKKSSVASPDAGLKIIKDGSIDFENVSFRYSEKAGSFALENVSLHIASGQVAGIIGGTGSSKTTLVSLIPRLYDVSAGAVRVGGEDVRRYDLTSLRDGVSTVLQKNVLFSGTIKENLKWGDKEASDEAIVAACKSADADGFIESFPLGYDTVLGQGGVNISGGQKQRLYIARALLKNPKILIFDDSTSAVDTATEARIRSALKTSHPETTKIIIAQRISSVRDADVIFVLDEGKINGFGTHEALLKSNAIYREVYESQRTVGD
ncbi:ABC transporter ATP-binding protein [Treponema socranskii]|uniref:ABC transporter ATP-binding protein n=1 Tax=Treponema socranskii TaxID=53419 RepID=UPI003D6E0315